MSQAMLLYTDEIGAAKREIQARGGSITHHLSPHVFVANLPAETDVTQMQTCQSAPLGDLSETEQIVAEAWKMLQDKQAEAPRADEGLAWDTAGFTAPDHDPPPFAESLARAVPFEEVLESTGTPTSQYMIGSVSVGIVIVSGTDPNLTISSQERTKIVAEVQEGLNFLANAEPRANLSFTYDIRFITVSVTPPTSCPSYEACEAPWRDAALQQMGYAGSRQGSIDYVNDLRSTNGTDWAYVAYFTKYPLKHFAYASYERLVMAYDNDGWGPDNINRVFAHETGHIFGAADEYGSCSCGASGYLQVPNKNCKNCTTNQVPCLMNANTLSLCEWSRGQIGWESSLLEQFTGPIGAASWGNNRYDVFGIDGDGGLKQLWWNGAWHWSNLGKPPASVGGGAYKGEVAAASWGPNRVDVFGVGVNGRIIQRWWNGSWHWSDIGAPPSSMGGGSFAGPLTAASWGNNRYDVFGLGVSNSIIQRWWNGSWHWSDLGKPPSSIGGGAFRGPLAAASWGPGRVDVFGVGVNGHVIQRWWNGSWHWSDLGVPPANVGGGAFLGELTAASWGPGRYDVFGVGVNGHIIQLWWNGAWHWSDLGAPPSNVGGGGFRDGLAAASWGPNRVDVFGVGVDGDVIQRWWNGSWNWSDLG